MNSILIPTADLGTCPLESYPNLRGQVPESWDVDCSFNTALELFNRQKLELAYIGLVDGVDQCVGSNSEVYTVRDRVWKKSGMEGWGGCLCIGCLERRIGRRLKPRDFEPDHPFNRMPGTERLLSRRGR